MGEHLVHRVLRLLAQLETPGGPVSSPYIARVLDEPYKDVKIACETAKYDELVWYDRCGYRMTIKGAEELSDTRTGDYTHSRDERKWIEEARTGIDKRGEPSSIDRAAVPTAELRQYNAEGYHERIWKSLAKIGVTRDNIDSVRICCQCWQIYLIENGCCDGQK